MKIVTILTAIIFVGYLSGIMALQCSIIPATRAIVVTARIPCHGKYVRNLERYCFLV